METVREARSRAGKLGAAARWGAQNGKSDSTVPLVHDTRVMQRRTEPLRAVARLRQAENRDWYRIRDAANTDTVLIDIYDEIGWFGITAQEFVRDLRQIGAGRIELHINSPGGDVFDAIAIYNALRHHPATVDVVIDSLAGSAASFIAMAGDTITATPNSMLMIHDPLGVSIGNAADMRELADLLDKHGDNIASIYAARAGGELADWRQRMLDETWYSAAEAAEVGLVDNVEDATAPTTNEVVDRPTAQVEPDAGEPATETRQQPDASAEPRPTATVAARPVSTSTYLGEPAVAASWYLPDPKGAQPWTR